MVRVLFTGTLHECVLSAISGTTLCLSLSDNAEIRLAPGELLEVDGPEGIYLGEVLAMDKTSASVSVEHFLPRLAT